MNTSLGYSKRTLDNTKVLLSGGGDKLLSDFIGSISWDAQNRKLKYTPVGGTATDLVTLGSNALNSTAYLPLSGGTIASGDFAVFNIQRNHTTNAAAIGFKHYSSGTTVEMMGYIGMNTKDGALKRWNAASNTEYTILDSSNSSVSKSGETLTVKINGTSQSLTNTNTWTAWAGATSSANGTAGYMPAPTSALRSQFLRGDGSWVSLNNYSLPTASNSTLGGVKTGAAITDVTGYTAAAIKDGVIYYKDTTYSAGTGLSLSDATFSINRTTSGAWFDGTAYVRSDGVMEVGRYIDFHPTSDTTIDYNVRLDAGAGTTSRIFTFPSNGGTFALSSDFDNAFLYRGSYVSDAYINGTYLTLSSGIYLLALSGATSTLLHFLSEGSVSGLDIYCHTYEASSGISYRKSVDKHHFASGWYKIIDDHNIGNYFKTINGQSIVGTGNITISGSGSVNNNTLGPTAYVNGTTSELPHIVWHIPNVSWGNLSLDSNGNFSLRLTDSTSASYANLYANLPDYLAKSGGTMTGALTLVGSRYNGASDYALHLNNSNIIGVNSIYTSDLADDWQEGINFARSNGNWDSFYAADGTFHFVANNSTVHANIRSASQEIFSTGSSWSEGIRIHPASNNWCGIILCSVANTGSTNTDTKTWSIHNNDGIFGIYKNGSSESASAYFRNPSGNMWYLNNALHITGTTTNDMSYTTTNPRIIFSEDNGIQQVGLVYTDFDSYRNSKGIKCMDVNNEDTNNVWFEAQGSMYATNFYTTSDLNKKKNIITLSEHIRKFQLKSTEKWHYGVIALEVPEMFRDGEEGNMTVNYDSVLSYYVGLLENKVKELEDKIKELETRLEIKELKLKLYGKNIN